MPTVAADGDATAGASCACCSERATMRFHADGVHAVECMQLPAALQVKGHAAPSNHLVSSYVLYVYCIFILLTEADYMLLYHILLLVFGCKFCVQQI